MKMLVPGGERTTIRVQVWALGADSYWNGGSLWLQRTLKKPVGYREKGSGRLYEVKADFLPSLLPSTV
jgi:hypothetical protein